MKKLDAKNRARHLTGVDRKAQALRALEIIRGLDTNERNIHTCTQALAVRGITMGRDTVYKHIQTVNHETNGSKSVVSEGTPTVDKIALVGRAIKACGGFDQFREVVGLIEKVRAI